MLNETPPRRERKGWLNIKYCTYHLTRGITHTEPCKSQESLIVHMIGFLNSFLIPTYSTHLKMTFNFLFTRPFQRYVMCQGSGHRSKLVRGRTLHTTTNPTMNAAGRNGPLESHSRANLARRWCRASWEALGDHFRRRLMVVMVVLLLGGHVQIFFHSQVDLRTWLI